MAKKTTTKTTTGGSKQDRPKGIPASPEFDLLSELLMEIDYDIWKSTILESHWENDDEWQLQSIEDLLDIIRSSPQWRKNK